MSEQHHLMIATRGRGSVEISDRISAIVKNAATRETTAGPRVNAGKSAKTEPPSRLFEHRTHGHQREIVVTLLGA